MTQVLSSGRLARPRVLVLDDDPAFRDAVARSLRGQFEPVGAADATSAKLLLEDGVDIALVDAFLASPQEALPAGIDFIVWAAGSYPSVPSIVMTAFPAVELAVRALRCGADDFIEKGRVGGNELRKRLTDVLERRRLQRSVKDLELRLSAYEARQLVGRSPMMADLRRGLRSVAADGDVTVLLRGESGTGKELAARMIHAEGPRRGGPFVAVDLSTLPRETMASELFGYERGAFTGAERSRAGFIEAADKGVLLLDEIGELPRDMQNSLLRVLEERAVTRLGSTNPRPLNIQLLAATNQDLEALVAANQFRRELYYRLRVFEIRLPALREHTEDVPELVDLFLTTWRKTGRTSLREVDSAAMRCLTVYGWPGNVRELRNTLEAATVRARMERVTVLSPYLLPSEVRAVGEVIPKRPPGDPTDPDNVVHVLANAELACAARALTRCSFRKSQARAVLGYRDRHTMRRRLLSLRDRFPELWAAYPELHLVYGQHEGHSRRRKGRGGTARAI